MFNKLMGINEMKIAVASNDLKHVTGHLGRCKSFIIYDTADGKVIDREIRQNTFTHHAQQGHHHGEGNGHSRRTWSWRRASSQPCCACR